MPASPHPQVTPQPELESRKVLGAILAERRCPRQVVTGHVIFLEV